MMWEKELRLLGVIKMPKNVLERARLLARLQGVKNIKNKQDEIKLRTRTWSGSGEGW